MLCISYQLCLHNIKVLCILKENQVFKVSLKLSWLLLLLTNFHIYSNNADAPERLKDNRNGKKREKQKSPF